MHMAMTHQRCKRTDESGSTSLWIALHASRDKLSIDLFGVLQYSYFIGWVSCQWTISHSWCWTVNRNYKTALSRFLWRACLVWQWWWWTEGNVRFGRTAAPVASLPSVQGHLSLVYKAPSFVFMRSVFIKNIADFFGAKLFIWCTSRRRQCPINVNAQRCTIHADNCAVPITFKMHAS